MSAAKSCVFVSFCHLFCYLIVLTMPVKISPAYFYFGETANLRVGVEIAIFSTEINAYFAVRFSYKNQFVSAQNLLKALLWYLDIRFT